jgi:hypothetical protein
MRRKSHFANAVLWAAAIVASAAAGSPSYFSTLLLPALAAGALPLTLPKRRAAKR